MTSASTAARCMTGPQPSASILRKYQAALHNGSCYKPVEEKRVHRDFQYDQAHEILSRDYPSNFAPRERAEPARAATSKMSRYHPYRASGDLQQKPYFSDTSATLGTLSPRYSVPACSALVGQEAASHPYESLLEAVYLPLRSRTPRSSKLDTCMSSTDKRAAMLSRAQQVLRDSQDLGWYMPQCKLIAANKYIAPNRMQNYVNTMGRGLMGRSISLTDELEAVTSPGRAALETIESPQRSQSDDLCNRPSYLQYHDECSEDDSDEEEDLDSLADTDDEELITCEHPDKPYSSPSVEPLGSVPDRVAKFEHIAQTSQSEECTQAEAPDYTQQPAVRTPRGTLRGVLPCGLPYRLNRISESSERSSLAVSAFDDVDPAHGNADGALTSRSWCNSVVSVESDCAENDIPADEDNTTPCSNEESTVRLGAIRKVAGVVVPTLQLKHVALKMPRITEEAQPGAPAEESRSAAPSAAEDDATPRPHRDTSDSAALPEASTDDYTSENVHPEEDPFSAGYQRPRQVSCSNPFIDEQEPSADEEQQQVLEPVDVQRDSTASAPTPRSDLVFGLHAPAAIEASKSLPSTQEPTPCMSLIHEDAATGDRDDSSAPLPVEQPLTPLVDSITCGGYQGYARQLRAQTSQEDASGGDEGSMKAGRQDGSKVPTGPLKTPRAQCPASEASLELLEMPTAATVPTASNSALAGLRQESRSSEMDAEASADECPLAASEMVDQGNQESYAHSSEDCKENAGDFLNVAPSPSRQPVPRLSLPKQCSAHALAKKMRATAKSAENHSTRAHNSTTSHSTTHEEYGNITQTSSPSLDLLTPRGNRMASSSVVGTTGLVSANGHVANMSPGWMSCWSALSSPDQLPMHAPETSQRSLGPVDETQEQPPATATGAASPCSKVITNDLFNPAHVRVAGSAEASMHLMNAESCPEPSNSTSIATQNSQAPSPDTTDTSSQHTGAIDTKRASDYAKMVVSEGGDDITVSPPPPESEPSHCDIRDALTLAVQQRDAALEEFLVVEQSKTEARAAAEKLRAERDRALKQVVELTHELAQCQREKEAQQYAHMVKLQALHSEIETLRNSTSNTLQESSALKKALNIQRLKDPHGKGGSKKPARAAKRAAQLFGPLSVPSAGVANGPRWLKETYCSVVKSQPSPRCEHHRL